MKRLFAIALMCAFSSCLHAQAVDTTVCEILKNPASFNGRIVRVKGTVVAGFDQFVVKGSDCPSAVNNNIWLDYPEGTKGKAGPAIRVTVEAASNFAGEFSAVSRTPVQLDKTSKDFKQFDALLAAPYKRGGMCLSCNKNTVTATLVGRLDGVAEPVLLHDKAGKVVTLGGFGNLNAYPARLVLQSVADVAAKEVDYSKNLDVTKSDTISDRTVPDPVMAAQKDMMDWGAAIISGDQLTRALEAFGKSGSRNGVELVYGAGNEAASKYEAKGQNPTTDGLQFTVTLNRNRADSEAEIRTAFYAGECVANLRTPLPVGSGYGLYDLTNRALVTTILDAINAKQKTLSLPGGTLAWNTAWPNAEANQKLQEAVSEFLKTEELLHR